MRLRNIPEAKDAIARSPYVIQEPASCKGRWQSLFPSPKPLFLEIGMGKGQFLMALSGRHPENNYLGMELYDSVLFRAVQKRERLEKEGVFFPNLHYICADARFLTDYFAPEEVSGIYLNFSDPWPKARHHKRRLTSHVFLERYTAILSPRGQVRFKTDNQELFAFSLEEAKGAGWRLLSVTWDLHSDAVLCRDNCMTEYEEKFSQAGKPICQMILQPPL